MTNLNKVLILTTAAIGLGLLTNCTPHTRLDEKKGVLVKKESFQASGWAAQSLPELAEALENGNLTSVELTQIYLTRIGEIDRAGPTLQRVIALNPDALAQAQDSDARRAAGETIGKLDGLPFLFKDNIETKDNIPTTAGSYALADNITHRDSPLVAGLRAEGAIIMGKTNLSQWANFRSNQSISGWSSIGGQVRNPHMLDRSPCGSSSGSGVAVAASLIAGAVGTETNGSIICPSNVNGIVGFKPTVGLVSQQYIVPISASQDTAGPMTKTVKGAAMMLAAMDNKPIDYVQGLTPTGLDGKRVGVLRFSQGDNPDIMRTFNQALDDLTTSGAVLVDIDAFENTAEDFGAQSYAVLQFEFKHGLNTYLASTPDTVTSRSLGDVISFNLTDADKELALFSQDIFEASEKRGGLDDPDYIKAVKAIQSAARENGIDMLLHTYNVDVLVAPSGPIASRIDPINGDVWPDWVGAGGLAAVAGYPHLTVPMGDVHGVPLGLSFIGTKGQDADILAYGYAYEQTSKKRPTPHYLKTAEDRTEIQRATQRKD